MWTLVDNVTNKVTVPADGIISVTKPDSILVHSYVNDTVSGVHHVHVKAGDTVYFKTENTTSSEMPVVLDYAGTSSTLMVPAGSNLQTKETKMTDAMNLFTTPSNTGAAMGSGLGAGLVGGLLGTMLFRNNGVLGGEGVVPATLPAIESVVNNAAINTALGDIKASIPYNEAQVQLALAGAQADINGNINNSNMGLTNALNTQSLATANNFASLNTNLSSSLSNITATVNATAAANLAATKEASILAERNAWALSQSITSDGDKTRALIQSIDKTNDSRTITTLANEISDLKNHANLATAAGNITISNTNTATAMQQQAQQQAQQQQIAVLTSQIYGLIQQNQNIQQGVLNIGSGTVSGNSQTAANTRVS